MSVNMNDSGSLSKSFRQLSQNEILRNKDEN